MSVFGRRASAPLQQPGFFREPADLSRQSVGRVGLSMVALIRGRGRRARLESPVRRHLILAAYTAWLRKGMPTRLG